MSAAKLVVNNTLFLYGKSALTMLITFYSVRLILDALGAEDYGLFTLVAGIITMLSFLNIAMAAATQRYLSVFLGAKNLDKLKDIFRSSVILHLVIGVVVVLILEIASLFLFDGFLKIPAGSVDSAKIIFQLMILSAFFTINAIPYDASINAHEDFFFHSIVGVFESLSKLGIAIWLTYTNLDRLIFYGVLIVCLTIVIRIIKSIWCLKKYRECKVQLRKGLDFPLFKEMFSFARWNLFGALCALGKTQGLAIILNIFMGTIVNAAYAIAYQLSAQLNFFTRTMLGALNPQIMKSEGSKDRERMFRLSFLSSKFGFYLLAFIALPCIFEMDSLLNFWLKEVPDYTISFCILIILAVMVNQITIGLDSAIQASGNIKRYMLVAGSIKLLVMPIGYVILQMGFSPILVMQAYVLIEFFAGIARLFILKKEIGLSINDYLNYIIRGISLPVIFTVAYLFFIVLYLDFELRFLLSLSTAPLLFVISTYIWGLTDSEKLIFKRLAIQFLTRLNTQKIKSQNYRT